MAQERRHHVAQNDPQLTATSKFRGEHEIFLAQCQKPAAHLAPERGPATSDRITVIAKNTLVGVQSRGRAAERASQIGIVGTDCSNSITAERTRYIRLGTGVISLPYHHPFMVADRIVQLDYQTRGRAMFGFGPGLLPSDAMMLGIDPETQRERMADAIDIITRLLAGEVITQEGEWYTMREARLHLRPYSKPRPHLAIASAVTPYGGKLAGRYDLGMLCVMAGSPNGYDTLDYNWELACAEAAAQGRVMDRNNYRVMAPFHIAETREKAIENVRAGFEKWQLYSYSVNPEGGAAIGMPSIEEINEGGRGAIGTPDDALRVLENYWAKTGGFGCILLLAHDWADWEATKRSYEMFARHVLPRFEERSAWRSQSMDWMRANREAFSARRKAAAASAVERHFAAERAGKNREAAK